MPLFRYAGPDPIRGDDGEIVRPGQVIEMDQPPDWGPWDEIPAQDGPQPSQDGPAEPALPAEPAAPARGSRTATKPATGKEGE